MRILYVAKHNSGGNQDEDAIGYALEELGHRVIRVPETGYPRPLTRFSADLLLFHKWSDFSAIRSLKDYYYRAFWYFDLVDFPSDSTLARRNRARKQWMSEVLPHVEIGFCTDGDWVENCSHWGLDPKQADYGLETDTAKRKIHWLPQGADKRYAGFGRRVEKQDDHILFTGIDRGGGVVRESFVKEMREKYGDKFTHIPGNVHGETLARVIARSAIIVAPDSPVTDRYYSNRVYLTLGFGGFLLHPLSLELTTHYWDEKELVFYRNREHLHQLIDRYLPRPEERSRIALAGHRRTLAEHTYHNRCAELIRRVEEGIKNAKHT